MQTSKWVSIVTGVIAVVLGLGYLVLVQILDWRGEMLPAPTDLSLAVYQVVARLNIELKAIAIAATYG